MSPPPLKLKRDRQSSPVPPSSLSDIIGNSEAGGNATGGGEGGGIKVKVKNFHAVARWSWGTPADDVCGICQSPFEGCAPGVKFPGDDCPVCWGECKHAFHLVSAARSEATSGRVERKIGMPDVLSLLLTTFCSSLAMLISGLC